MLGSKTAATHLDATDNQGEVIQTAREQCREHLRAGRDFAFNATNTTALRGYEVPKDTAEGLKWLRSAGIAGEREAQVALVGRYRGGPDSTADPIEQLCWLIVIASEEPTASQEALRALRGQMKPADVVEARRRAEAIISAKPKSN